MAVDSSLSDALFGDDDDDDDDDDDEASVSVLDISVGCASSPRVELDRFDVSRLDNSIGGGGGGGGGGGRSCASNCSNGGSGTCDSSGGGTDRIDLGEGGLARSLSGFSNVSSSRGFEADAGDVGGGGGGGLGASAHEQEQERGEVIVLSGETDVAPPVHASTNMQRMMLDAVPEYARLERAVDG